MANIEIFEDRKLNGIAQELIRLGEDYTKFMGLAKKNMTSAFQVRWTFGKIVSENYDYIKEVCRTQREFAEALGYTEAEVSNNKRAYQYLRDKAGATTWEEVMDVMEDKRIPLTVYSFERIGALLSAPEKPQKKKTEIEKAQERLEELNQEAQELLRIVEPENNPNIEEDIEHFIGDLEDMKEHIKTFDIYKSGWKSEKYLEFVRNFGYDVLTGEPVSRCDPHHTDPEGGSGSMGAKLPDYFTIPVARGTHMLLESGALRLDREELMEALIITMATFISKMK